MNKYVFLLLFLLVNIFCYANNKVRVLKPNGKNHPLFANSLKFSVDSITFTFFSGGALRPQSVTLSASTGSPTVTLTSNASAITAPAGKLGAITIDGSNVRTALTPGTYKARIIANAPGYTPDSLIIRLIVIDQFPAGYTSVNFGDHNSTPPAGWLRDFGQGFGLRTGAFQSTGLYFGWRRRSDKKALEMTSNGFNRSIPENILLSTLIYMQANNVAGTFPGTKTAAYWEMKIPNGTYDVTVGVGDPKIDINNQSNYINVEGVRAITAFVPSGAEGSNSRFKQATVRVTVNDEALTITADGGTNTKINFLRIWPVTISPYLGWADNALNVIIKKGSTNTQRIGLLVGNSNNTTLTYSFSVSYGAGQPTGWLKFNTTQTGIMPVINLDYKSAASLPIGMYTVAVRVSKSGYTSATTNIQLRVVDDSKPYVISSSPANNDVNVSSSIVSVAANNLHVPVVSGFKGGVNNSTITTANVYLQKITNGIGSNVPGVVQGTGGGDAISFSPSTSLLPATTYRFSITSGVKSYSGASFIPFTSTFTTSPAVATPVNPLNVIFTKVPIPGTQKKNYTCLKFGPDDKLYALRLDGTIERYTVNHTDGTLSSQQILSTLVSKYGNRSAIGLVFDPQSTASNLICYVTHSSAGLTNSPTFDGKISKLTGANLQTENLMITNLPRSTRDHMANSLAFGPDGALYQTQGSNSSAGAIDNDWQRAESLLSGTVLRIDMAKLNALPLPLNVMTTSTQSVINSAPSNSRFMSDGTYNPYSTASPVTIYASGVRNAYSLLWHSNGQLYVPTNGSGGGGNSPASVNGTRRPDGSSYNGPIIPATTGVQVQVDWLFRVNPLKGVGYFGHPNPFRGEYVENRGYTDNPLYPSNILPDVNYRGAAYNFGLNNSPNGVIEYKSNTFNGALKNKLLVCRFSGGGDIVVMEPGSLVKDPTMTASSDDSKYDISKVTTGAGNNGLVGMSGFANPLNLVEDLTNGNLYVIEYNWDNLSNLTAQITLLRVTAASGTQATKMNLTANKEADDNGLISLKNYSVLIENRGDADLKVKSIVLEGTDASNFQIAGIPLPDKNNPLVMNKNTSLSFMVSTPIVNEGSSVKVRVTSVDDSVKEVLLSDKQVSNEVKFSTESSKLKTGVVAEPSLRVYPNPNTGEKISVELDNFGKNEPVTISLIDILGNEFKSVKVQTDSNGSYSTVIPLPQINNMHLFIVRAVAPSQTKEAKVIVNK